MFIRLKNLINDQTKVLGTAIMGYAFDSFDLMIISLTLPLILKEWHLSMVQGGFIVSAMLVGGVLGGYIFGPIADKFGRKKALMICLVFFGVTTGLSGFAQDYVQLAVLRFLAGLGLGAEWALGATLLAEFTPADKRGKYNSYMQMGWPLGFIIALVLQYLLVPTFGWRIMYFIGALPVIGAIYVRSSIPESPMWLKAQEMKKLGTEVVAKVKATDLFKIEYRKTFIYTIVISTCLLMAYWAVNAWLPTILSKEKGMDVKSVSTFLLSLNFVSIPTYFIASFLVDKIGKRKFIIIMSVMAAISLYVFLGIPWVGYQLYIAGMVNWSLATCLWAGFGAYLSEQFPTNVRAVGVATSFSTGRAVVVGIPMILGAAVTSTLTIGYVVALMSIFYLVGGFAAFMLKENKNIQ